MGLLTLFSKASPTLLRFPSGSFTVDREGSVIVGTLPSSFPSGVVKDISEQILAAFNPYQPTYYPPSRSSPIAGGSTTGDPPPAEG